MTIARLMKTGSLTRLDFTPDTDIRGDRDQGTWADGDTYNAWFAPPSSSEALAGRDTTVIDLVAFLPADATISETSRARDGDGQVYTVEGLPVKARRPGSGIHHLEVRLKAAVDL